VLDVDKCKLAWLTAKLEGDDSGKGVETKAIDMEPMRVD